MTLPMLVCSRRYCTCQAFTGIPSIPGRQLSQLLETRRYQLEAGCALCHSKPPHRVHMALPACLPKGSGAGQIMQAICTAFQCAMKTVVSSRLCVRDYGAGSLAEERWRLAQSSPLLAALGRFAGRWSTYPSLAVSTSRPS